MFTSSTLQHGVLLWCVLQCCVLSWCQNRYHILYLLSFPSSYQLVECRRVVCFSQSCILGLRVHYMPGCTYWPSRFALRFVMEEVWSEHVQGEGWAKEACEVQRRSDWLPNSQSVTAFVKQFAPFVFLPFFLQCSWVKRREEEGRGVYNNASQEACKLTIDSN